MKKLIFIICLVSSNCFAQEATTQSKLEMVLGKLIIENIDLSIKVENLNKQVKDLQKVIDDKKEIK